jgi:hypothetical protein
MQQQQMQQQMQQQQQQMQQQHMQQQHMQQQQQQMQQQQMHSENNLPKPVPSLFINPNMANPNTANPNVDHAMLAGNLSPRVKSRDMPTLNQPPAARRSNAHRRAQSNTADDIVRRLDPTQLNNIRSVALMNQQGTSPVKRN